MAPYAPLVQGLAYKGDESSGDGENDENLIGDEGFIVDGHLGNYEDDYMLYYDKDGNYVQEWRVRGVFEYSGTDYRSAESLTQLRFLPVVVTAWLFSCVLIKFFALLIALISCFLIVFLNQ